MSRLACCSFRGILGWSGGAVAARLEGQSGCCVPPHPGGGVGGAPDDGAAHAHRPAVGVLVPQHAPRQAGASAGMGGGVTVGKTMEGVKLN